MGRIVNFHFNIVARFVGLGIIVIGILQIIVFLYSLFSDDWCYKSFLISSITSLLLGVILVKIGSKDIDSEHKISIRDSFLIILLMWFLVPILGAIPFVLCCDKHSFLDALFESYAGFTTTGFTFLSEYNKLSPSIILWRSIIQWLGGMGLMIFIIALFPLLKEAEFKIFFSDMQDTSYKPLHHKITTTARLLWSVYISLTLIGFSLLLLSGENWLSALQYSLSSISSGGTSLTNGNLSNLSVKSKIIIMLLMLMAGANYFYVFQIFKRQKNFTSEETFTYFMLFLSVTILIFIPNLIKHNFSWQLLLECFFNSASFVSTTGFYSNTSFDTSTLFVWMVLFFIMFIGSSTGSSGGGINIYRLIIIFKTLTNYIKSIVHPQGIYPIRFNNEIVEIKIVNRIFAFFVLYFIIFLVGSMLLTFFGLDFKQAISFCATSLSNSGPGVFLLNGFTNLINLNEGVKVTIILLMLVGRIELFPFLIIFSKTFWKP